MEVQVVQGAADADANFNRRLKLHTSRDYVTFSLRLPVNFQVSVDDCLS